MISSAVCLLRATVGSDDTCSRSYQVPLAALAILTGTMTLAVLWTRSWERLSESICRPGLAIGYANE
jgi:hypothetical protein